MRAALRRIDAVVARGEAILAGSVLLGMIVAASVQAVLRNLTGAGAGWANPILAELDWIDPFLQTGTLWVAFLGASLAAHGNRHIAVDVVARFAPPRARLAMRALAFLAAGAVCLVLSQVFLEAVLVLGSQRTLDYEVLRPDGSPIHVCDAPASVIDGSGVDRPSFFCGVRGVLTALGLPVETPTPALYLVAPLGFLMIGLRFLLRGVVSSVDLLRGDAATAAVAPPTPGAPGA
ncbi:MAG TPA: TRAP transporter small permease subunit [Polyangiaceae bacterium LLY-WYZ-14_1]|nr:TRAP transporter small permease subunit [Polyangiaceae bacterium LLY-WYZ-14_1]